MDFGSVLTGTLLTDNRNTKIDSQSIPVTVACDIQTYLSAIPANTFSSADIASEYL